MDRRRFLQRAGLTAATVASLSGWELASTLQRATGQERKPTPRPARLGCWPGTLAYAELHNAPELEPLREELLHFADCVRTRKTPRTDGRNGLDVLRVLDAGQRSLDGGGKPVALR